MVRQIVVVAIDAGELAVYRYVRQRSHVRVGEFVPDVRQLLIAVVVGPLGDHVADPAVDRHRAQADLGALVELAVEEQLQHRAVVADSDVVPTARRQRRVGREEVVPVGAQDDSSPGLLAVFGHEQAQPVLAAP